MSKGTTPKVKGQKMKVGDRSPATGSRKPRAEKVYSAKHVPNPPKTRAHVQHQQQLRPIKPIVLQTRTKPEMVLEPEVETDSYYQKLTAYTRIDPSSPISEKILIRISDTMVDCSPEMRQWFDWTVDDNPEPVGILTILDECSQYMVFQVHLQAGFLCLLGSYQRLRLFDIRLKVTEALDGFIHRHRYVTPKICLTLFQELLSSEACKRFPFPVVLTETMTNFREPPSILDETYITNKEPEASILNENGQFYDIIEVFGLPD